MSNEEIGHWNNRIVSAGPEPGGGGLRPLRAGSPIAYATSDTITGVWLSERDTDAAISPTKADAASSLISLSSSPVANVAESPTEVIAIGTGTAVSPEGDSVSTEESAARGGNGVDCATKTVETSSAKISICRVLVTDLKGGRGNAKTDYRIDLEKSKAGLYDIVDLIYTILRKEKLTSDSIHSHLWNLQFGGMTYQNGWRRKMTPYADAEYDRPSNEYDLDEGQRRILNSLEKPIEIGQKGQCSGESAQFSFVVENANVEVEDEPTNTPPVYTCITAVPIKGPSKVENDWVTSDERSRALQLSSAWQSYMQGENSWKRDRRTHEYIRTKPLPRCWSGDEVEILGLLINAGAQFKKSWTSIMQFAFIGRAETATSGQWYKLKKEDYRREHTGKGLSSAECIRLAKRLSESLLRRQFENGAPKKEPHPWKRSEDALRKRKKIDDTTSPAEKRRLILMHREFGNSESDSEDSFFDRV